MKNMLVCLGFLRVSFLREGSVYGRFLWSFGVFACFFFFGRVGGMLLGFSFALFYFPKEKGIYSVTFYLYICLFALKFVNRVLF